MLEELVVIKSRAPPREPAALDADLAKSQGELSDWVHCASSKTLQGKAKIEEISARISLIKAKIEESDSAKGASPSMTKSSDASRASVGEVAFADRVRDALSVGGTKGEEGWIADARAPTTIGGIVDVFV